MVNVLEVNVLEEKVCVLAIYVPKQQNSFSVLEEKVCVLAIELEEWTV